MAGHFFLHTSLFSDYPLSWHQCFLAHIDPHGRTFVHASAGQQGFLLDARGTMTKLDSTGPPLGIEPTVIIQCAPAVHLGDGSFVLLITDGIFEARCADGRSFGLDRAFEIVRTNRALPAERIAQQLCQAVRVFSQNGSQCDDITAVVIKTLPSVVSVRTTTETSGSFRGEVRTNG